MKIQALLTFTVLLALCLVLPAIGQGFTDARETYEFKAVPIGGGGWVTGLLVHPLDADARYARTDVGGAYRWDPDAQAWVQMVTEFTLPPAFHPETIANDHRGVESIAIDPTDPLTVYMAYELPRVTTSGPQASDGRVFRSTDGGRSFTDLNVSFDQDANSIRRIHGERLAVDPNHTATVYYGTMSSGLMVTHNADAENPSWTRVELPDGATGREGEGLLTVKFDPSAGTTDRKTAVLYAATFGQGIFRSQDAGQTWSKITDKPNTPEDGRDPTDLEVLPDGSVLVTYTRDRKGPNDNLWRYDPADGAWTNLTPNKPSHDHNLVSIAIDPNDPDRWLVGSGGLQHLYYTEDAGASWRQLKGAAGNKGWTLHEPIHPSWLEQANITWFSSTEFFFDPVVANRLWFPAGTGIYRVDDFDQDVGPNGDDRLEMVFDAFGIEELVPMDLVKPKGGDLIVVTRDRIGFRIPDLEKYTARQINGGVFGAGWDVAVHPNDPKTLAMVAVDIVSNRNRPNFSALSTDGGVSWQRFADHPNAEPELSVHPRESQGVRFGDIAISGNGQLVWFPVVFGKNAHLGRMPLYSHDQGKTWTRVAASNWPTVDGKPLDTGQGNRNFSDNPLAADANDPDTFYFASLTHGLLRSTDGGVSWDIWSTDLPGWGNHRQLVADPTNPDAFWYAHGFHRPQRGLWHSTDNAKTWTRINAITEAVNVAVGPPMPGSSHPTVFVAGAIGESFGLFRSTDHAQTWTRVARFPGGLFSRPWGFGTDPDHSGRIFLGVNAIGFIYGQPIDSP